MHMIIIGNSAAGLAALEAIRKSDNESEVTLISKETEKPFSRVLLPYFLRGKTSYEKMLSYKKEDYFQSLNARCIPGKVIKVDTEAKNVQLEDGRELAYDRLLVASGSSPVAPPIPGLDGDDVFSMWFLDDAKKLEPKFAKGGRVLVLGSGFVALQAAWAALSRGLQVTVLEIMPRIMPMVLDDHAAELLAELIKASGVDLRVNAVTEKVGHRNSGGITAHLKGGEQIDADFMIVATGVKSNADFLLETGVAIDRGILVNRRMETNIKDIYAAGDVAQGPASLDDLPVVHALWPTALHMGLIAGTYMAGGSMHYRGSLNMNVTQMFGITVSSMGRFVEIDGDDSWIDEQLPQGHYQKIVTRQGVPQGAIALGDSGQVSTLGMLRPLIREKIKFRGGRGELKDLLARSLVEHHQAFTA